MGPENERGAAQVMYHARTTRRNKEESDCGKIEKEGDERSGEEDFIGAFPFRDDDGIGGGGEKKASIAYYMRTKDQASATEGALQ